MKRARLKTVPAMYNITVSFTRADFVKMPRIFQFGNERCPIWTKNSLLRSGAQIAETTGRGE
jgi:hypothetical protein